MENFPELQFQNKFQFLIFAIFFLFFRFLFAVFPHQNNPKSFSLVFPYKHNLLRNQWPQAERTRGKIIRKIPIFLISTLPWKIEQFFLIQFTSIYFFFLYCHEL